MDTITKILEVAQSKKITQKALEQSAILGTNRLTKLKEGQEPGLWECLRIARVLDVPLEWLADESAADEPSPHEASETLTREEAEVIRWIRDSGLPLSEVRRRLLGGAGDWRPVRIATVPVPKNSGEPHPKR
jgi:transcriptional regulator with XRE-family HTH domain